MRFRFATQARACGARAVVSQHARRVTSAWLLLGMFGASGCLGSLHRLEHDELARLARQPAATRHEEVLVTQAFDDEDRRGPPRSTNVPPRTEYTRESRFGGIRIGGNGGDGAAILLFAFAGLGYAVGEAVRFDGIVRVHPAQPLYLILDEDRFVWVPISELTPELAMAARSGVIYDDEGAFETIERAPLDRRGFVFSLEAGMGAWADSGGSRFVQRTTFGGFVTHELGLALAMTLGPRAHFPRFGLELLVVPLRVGPLSLGAYAEPAFAYADQEGDRKARFSMAGGGLAELELSSRCALRLRAGGSTVSGQTQHGAFELMGGIAIY